MTIDLQPTLTGETLVLRPLRFEDWDALFAAASDPLIWELHPSSDRYRESVFREYFDARMATGGALAVEDRQTGSIIGSSTYAGHIPEERKIEIGWTFLTRKYWGGSSNREMKRMMLVHIFQFVDTVVFNVGKANYRSRAAMEKIGGVLTNQSPTLPVGGVPVEHVVYMITKSSFVTSALFRES